MFIYALPFIAAIIGWLTNYMAIKMLFHPKEKVKILFFEIQGIFPKRQDLLAEKLAKVVSDELFSFKDIKSRLNANGTQDLTSIKMTIDQKIDEYLDVKLPSKHLFTGIMVGLMRDQTKEELKEELLNEVDNVVPLLINQYIDNLEKSIDIEKIVYEKVTKFSTSKIEDILNAILEKELRFIEIVGAVLGFFIGVIQVLLIVFTT